MSKIVVGSMSDWSGVLKDFFRQIEDGSIGLEQVKALLEHRNPFLFSEATCRKLTITVRKWQRFYHDLGISADFSGLRIPEHQPGLDRLILIPQGLTIQAMFDACSRLFKTWKWTNQNLDEAIPFNDRDPKNGAYAIWVRDRQEADEELKNLSANDLSQHGIKGITFLERLALEAKYFQETGQHLDIHNITICSGSRVSGGDVPRVDWLSFSRQMRVSWCDPDHAGAACSLCSRAVVS